MENTPLDDTKKDLIAWISHELHSPIVGIRNNVSFLQRRIWELDRNLIERKLENIFYDSDRLLLLLKELDILLGLSSHTRKLDKVLFLRDVLLMAIQSIKPLLVEKEIDVSQVIIDHAKFETQELIIIGDKDKLILVVFNLLQYAIMHAHKDPKEFRIQIQLEETSENHIIKFKDWGLGINSVFEQQVLAKEFVTSDKDNNNIQVLRSKIALSKRIMIEMGGDLKLIKWINPTELHMVLPKKHTPK